ncbi:FCD domain-containing protein [Mycobacterium sp. AZCC_0083]|uniref:FCD domain-containing protein n=1 Tax=Mycobacterium sp. AZCC_0083 TaxID=2735882 RepID=UPI001832615E|nr:FCD domain-containing protein [Mycobacterium sp. AZCC_0083]MBB5161195.1 DNA-binding GntR family transcriptional regulator [Mycobacterium sp. AZCC_0083]
MDPLHGAPAVELACAETVKGSHDPMVTAAHNDYLADAMAPLQGLSRRFWLTHVLDAHAEIGRGAALHATILTAILDRDRYAARAAYVALNDYLVAFAVGALHQRRA